MFGNTAPVLLAALVDAAAADDGDDAPLVSDAANGDARTGGVARVGGAARAGGVARAGGTARGAGAFFSALTCANVRDGAGSGQLSPSVYTRIAI
jgi:hypothetical protein